MHEKTSRKMVDVLSFQMSVTRYKIEKGTALNNSLALNHKQVHPQDHGIGGGTLSTNGVVMVKVIVPVITVWYRPRCMID